MSLTARRPAWPHISTVDSYSAWLSVCVLLAAWGSLVDATWRNAWLLAGVFGLSASIGLEAMSRIKTARERRRRERTIRMRLETARARKLQHSGSVESIGVAVRRLAEQAVKQRNDQTIRSGRAKRWRSLLLGDYPFELTPIDEGGESRVDSPERITGSLRRISPKSVSFDHAEPLPLPLALLTFQLGAHDQVCFVVDIASTQPFGRGFTSSGTILAVSSPLENAGDRMSRI